MRWWPHKEEEPLPPIYVGSYEDKLRRIRRFHVDPDDDQMTREDKARERAYNSPDRLVLPSG